MPRLASGHFFKAVMGACSREQTRNKKAKATQRVALKSFGLDQRGGEVGGTK